MEDEKEAAAEETRWRARRTCEGLGVYNATIAGCDRSCELRAGNLGVPCTRISARRMQGGRRREGVGGGGGWNDGRTSDGRNEREEGSNARTRVRGCIDTSLRRWFVIL